MHISPSVSTECILFEYLSYNVHGVEHETSLEDMAYISVTCFTVRLLRNDEKQLLHTTHYSADHRITLGNLDRGLIVKHESSLAVSLRYQVIKSRCCSKIVSGMSCKK